MSGGEFDFSGSKPVIFSAKMMKLEIEKDSEIRALRVDAYMLKQKISTLETELKEKEVLLREFAKICSKYDEAEPVIAIASSMHRSATPPINVPIRGPSYGSVAGYNPDGDFPPLSETTASAPVAMETSPEPDTSNPYPPGIYEEIPCRGERGGQNCGCSCLQFALEFCCAENSSEPFMQALLGFSESMRGVEAIYNAHRYDYIDMEECIIRHMTRERAIDSFNICKACNCCERHKRNFPSSFGVIEPESEPEAALAPEIIRELPSTIDSISHRTERAYHNLLNELSNDANDDNDEGPWIHVERRRNRNQSFIQREGEFYDSFYDD